MYRSQTIPVDKELGRILRTMFKYQRRSLSIAVWTDPDNPATLECHGTYWSGGSRNAYQRWLANGELQPIACPSAPPQFGGGEAPTIPLAPDELIVTYSCFRGKNYIRLTGSPEGFEAHGIRINA